MDALLQALTGLGPAAIWLVIFLAAIIAVFVLYIGIALRAVLRAQDEAQRVITATPAPLQSPCSA